MFNLLPIQVRIGLALLVLAMAFSAGVVTRSIFYKVAENSALKAKIVQAEEQAKQIKEQQAKINQLSAELSRDQAQIKTVTETVTRLQRVEVEKPIYRECVLPLSGIEMQNKQRAELNKLIEGTK